MSTFVLVHGAWHGAWNWSRLLPEMETRGHFPVVMDLPVEDGDATFEDDADAVLASYPADVEDAVLVGHSLGAMVLPLVAAARPVSMLVFLCGLIPNVLGRPWMTRLRWVGLRPTRPSHWMTGRAFSGLSSPPGSPS
jgi:pimeloyl-ACP methyl ester carboxylesterase